MNFLKPLFLITFISFFSGSVDARVRIKDIASVGGNREIELIGYGLVTGLEGTGDKAGTRPTAQSLGSLLKKMGVTVSPESLASNNVAAVAVTARISGFSSIGSIVDGSVSSLGNATSLEGGTLLVTPLMGVDGNIYGSAQGKIQVENGESKKRTIKSVATSGSVLGGVILERDVSSQVVQNENEILIRLNQPDFVTAERIMDVVKSAFSSPCLAKDPARIHVTIPEDFRNDPIGFSARLESLTLDIDNVARVVINEKTGTVISGKDVRISAVTIAHGNLEIKIDGKSNLQVPDSSTVTTMVSMLSNMGASAWDIVTIFKALKKAGALNADLVIM
ncbi:MAG: flagellar basal body P-ring protein FlgI [Elusimicrobiota bacterium]